MTSELGTSLITVRIDNDVAEITLNRADRRNALSRKMMQDLTIVAARGSDRDEEPLFFLPRVQTSRWVLTSKRWDP